MSLRECNKHFIPFSLVVTFMILFIEINVAKSQVLNINNACTNFTCRYGECEQFEKTYLCHCFKGVKGPKCDRLMLQSDYACLSNPCWGGGNCSVIGADWKCDCPAGRTGKDCRTISSAPCLYNNPCRNNAVCRVTDNKYFCFCVGDWTGQFCETRLQLCATGSLACYNGGVCVNNICNCPKNFTGYQCETFNPPSTDKIVKVLNKGWYVANVKLSYDLYVDGQRKIFTQSGSILAGQDIVFRVPFSVVYESQHGTILLAEAVAGKQILSTRIKNNPECFHVWGTTQFPAWSYMPCWDNL